MLYESFRLHMFSASPTEALVPRAAPQLSPPLTVPRTYQVDYRLKRGTMYLGRVTSSFFVPCTRRFPTDELNVILAELYEEIGPAHDLLGIEILTVCRYHSAGPEMLHRAAPSCADWE